MMTQAAEKDIQASPAVYPQGHCKNGPGDPDPMKIIRQLTALSIMAGSMLFIAQATASTPVQKDSPVINTLFAQTKPQCIGRYVIDVPESFNDQLHDMIFIDSFKIESKPLYPPAFKQRVQLRK